MFALLLVLHIFSAVAVIGSAFLVPIIRRSAKTAAQLRFFFDMTTKVTWISKIGAALLVITGIWLMVHAKAGFTQMWLNLSILLSLVLVVTIGGFIEPRIQRIEAASKGQGHELSDEVRLAMRKLVPLETTAQLLILAVTVLMVVKPMF
ncbi:DUF2269 family protein [Cohnella hashimotonis]|uniref:DUF2269 family protein n=1 Tax=Cohnella hashimotonis TaxID=2826895 RepID=A0ABT6TSK0_9BACL|nr:DUF2269 family protein [Cohnella hashimotonis]MDI4649694.1 DUF2269 family protein [Cohnella hashimotonis]